MNLEQRKKTHKQVCGNPDSRGYQARLNRYIRDHGNFDNWEFDVLQECPPGTSKDNRLRLEQAVIDKYGKRKTLNTARAISSTRWNRNKENEYKRKRYRETKLKRYCECVAKVCLDSFGEHRRSPWHLAWVTKYGKLTTT